LRAHRNLSACAPHTRTQAVAQRLSKLGTFRKSGAPTRLPAEVLIKRRQRGASSEAGQGWEVVRARGHLDEVLEMRQGGSKLGACAWCERA
jgi:cGMP-dependent protein kinase 2